MANNLCRVADRIVYSDCRMVIVGDSITNKSAPTALPCGIYQTWRPRTWAGRVTQSHHGTSDGGTAVSQNGGSGLIPITQLPPGWAFSGGEVAIAPVYALDYHFTADFPAGSHYIWAYLTGMQNYSGGDWAAWQALTARVIYWRCPRTVPEVQLQAYRGGWLTAPEDRVLSGPNDETGWVEAAIPWGWGESQLRVLAAPHVDETETYFYHFGTVFYRPDVTGFQFDSVSIGGWTAADHLNQNKCSDTALAGYLRATRSPNVVMIWIGQNMTSDEWNVPGVWRSNIQAMIERYRTATVAAGAENPLFLLVATYRASDLETRYDWMAHDLYELSVTNADTGFINLCALAGSYENMNAQGYFRDGLHPSMTGSIALSQMLWDEIMAAAGDEPFPDLNADGLVNTYDLVAMLDAYGQPVVPGSGADLTHDGMVGTADLVILLSRWGQGCE